MAGGGEAGADRGFGSAGPSSGISQSLDSGYAHSHAEFDGEEVSRAAAIGEPAGLTAPRRRAKRPRPETKAPSSAAPSGKVTTQKAFMSVHDMIHAAILSSGQGASASLRHIYSQSERDGRILYKRSGGSRLITDNEHWKSQIRHALYTSGRFARCEGTSDMWQVASGYAGAEPATTRVEVACPPAPRAERRPSVDHSGVVGEAAGAAKGKRSASAGQKAGRRKAGGASTMRSDAAEEISFGGVVSGQGPAANASLRRKRSTRGRKQPPSASPALPIGPPGAPALWPSPLGEIWAQSQMAAAGSSHPPAGANSAALALQSTVSILNLMGSIMQSHSQSCAGGGGASQTGYSGVSTPPQLEEEPMCPHQVCLDLSAEQRDALIGVLQQCDAKVAETFRAAVKQLTEAAGPREASALADRSPAVGIGGVAKLMIRAFVSSLSRGLTLSSSKAATATAPAQVEPSVDNLLTDRQASAAAAANTDTASSAAVLARAGKRNERRGKAEPPPVLEGAVKGACVSSEVAATSTHVLAGAAGEADKAAARQFAKTNAMASTCAASAAVSAATTPHPCTSAQAQSSFPAAEEKSAVEPP